MTLEEMMKHFKNESALELSAASEQDIDRLVAHLQKIGHDHSDYAQRLYDIGCEEMRCIMAEARLEFAEFL
jgi:hypothetical protein